MSEKPPIATSDVQSAEPTLFDGTDLYAIGQWILTAAATGIIGAAAYDVLKSLKQRMGLSRVHQLKEKVTDLIDADQSLDPRQKESIAQQLNQLFEEFD